MEVFGFTKFGKFGDDLGGGGMRFRWLSFDGGFPTIDGVVSQGFEAYFHDYIYFNADAAKISVDEKLVSNW